MAVAALCEEILAQLHSELEHLEGQRDVLKRERASLLHQDLEGILDCAKQKETLHMEWKVLEESRRHLLPRLARTLGVAEEKISLETLMDRVEESQRSSLMRMREELGGVLDQVEELTEGNRFLVESALSRVSRSILFLRQFWAGGANTYDVSGRLRQGKTLSWKVRREA